MVPTLVGDKEHLEKKVPEGVLFTAIGLGALATVVATG